MPGLATTIAALGATVVLAGAANAAPAKQPQLATAKVAECVRGGAPGSAHATFRGAMRRTLGADHMAMRFTLEEKVVRPPTAKRGARNAASGWTTIKAPGLAVWRTSRHGVRMFAYRQNVLALSADSSYRVQIAYRWYDVGGTVIKRLKRRSPPCRPAGLPSGT
jgi:hypothetical protein